MPTSPFHGLPCCSYFPWAKSTFTMQKGSLSYRDDIILSMGLDLKQRTRNGRKGISGPRQLTEARASLSRRESDAIARMPLLNDGREQRALVQNGGVGKRLIATEPLGNQSQPAFLEAGLPSAEESAMGPAATGVCDDGKGLGALGLRSTGDEDGHGVVACSSQGLRDAAPSRKRPLSSLVDDCTPLHSVTPSVALQACSSERNSDDGAAELPPASREPAQRQLRSALRGPATTATAAAIGSAAPLLPPATAHSAPPLDDDDMYPIGAGPHRCACARLSDASHAFVQLVASTPLPINYGVELPPLPASTEKTGPAAVARCAAVVVRQKRRERRRVYGNSMWIEGNWAIVEDWAAFERQQNDALGLPPPQQELLARWEAEAASGKRVTRRTAVTIPVAPRTGNTAFSDVAQVAELPSVTEPTASAPAPSAPSDIDSES